VIAIAVPVIVNVALRAAPVLAETANWTTPLPMPDAPDVTVRNAALLTAVHAQVDGVVTLIEADPPAAPNIVVVVPVMIWHPPGDVVEELDPQATANNNSAAEKVTRTRRERWLNGNRFINTLCDDMNDLRRAQE
jgi:hypothetical protein